MPPQGPGCRSARVLLFQLFSPIVVTEQWDEAFNSLLRVLDLK